MLQESPGRTQTSLMELAQQSDPLAIAVLLNRALQPKGVMAKAVLAEDCLHILLEGDPVPEQQQTLVALLNQGLQRIKPDAIAAVMIYGRQMSQGTPAWTQRLELSASPDKVVKDANEINLEVLSPQPGLEILDNVPLNPSAPGENADAINPLLTASSSPNAIAKSPSISSSTIDSWYGQLAIGTLIVLFFPAGLYLMWHRTRWPMPIKWAVTLPFILILVAAMLAPPKPSTAPKTSSSPLSPQQSFWNGAIEG